MTHYFYYNARAYIRIALNVKKLTFYIFFENAAYCTEIDCYQQTPQKKHQQTADAFKIARFALTLMIDTTNCHHILATTVVGKRRLTL